MIIVTERQLDLKLSRDFDPELEAWEGRKYRYFYNNGQVQKLLVPSTIGRGPGSFLTGTNWETIYTNAGVAPTALATFTTEAVANVPNATNGPQPVLPSYFFLPSPNSLGKALRIVARGILSTTSAPTYTWTCRAGAANSTAGPIIAGTVATTAATTVTSKGWEFEADIVVKTMAAEGGNSTLQGVGLLASPAGLASPFAAEVWGGAAQPGTVATFDVSITNHINFNFACGTSNASNSIQLLQLLVFGLN